VSSVQGRASSVEGGVNSVQGKASSAEGGKQQPPAADALKNPLAPTCRDQCSFYQRGLIFMTRRIHYYSL
jgi:hypothetical protein